MITKDGIVGQLQTSSWEKDGISRYDTEIVTSRFKMFGSEDEIALYFRLL